MKEYRVELTALAVVRQVQYVEASSETDAKKVAREYMGDHEWEYDALFEPAGGSKDLQEACAIEATVTEAA